MNEKRVLEIESEINSILLEILEPIRMSKTVNMEVFSRFYELLEELKEILSCKEVIPRKLAGLLFFIYKTMVAESEHSNYNEPIFIATATIEAYLDEILWESPWK